MKKNKKFRSIRIFLCITLIFVLLLSLSNSISAEQLKIGISQIVRHPALDACREGFISGMEKAGYAEGTDVVYDFQDAQGEFSNAIAII